MQTPFQHIADTAFWVAGFRAQETKRPDAVYKDPLAEKLAGERGKQMVDDTPNAALMSFSIAIRTTAIDRLIDIAIADGIDTVINLGAGLDTRPYRMQLPIGLNWIEVDYDHVVDYKNTVLADESPACNLRRIAADLSADAERKELFTELGSQVDSALIITEGVITYLQNEQAAQLSQDIFSIPTFQFWIQEYLNGGYRSNGLPKKGKKLLKNTPFRFTVADPISFFKKDGWRVKENIYMLDEGDRIGRKMPFGLPWNILIHLFPQKIREGANKKFGILMFGKT
jgi:methyltransferase (TIGR00027 family)